MGFLAFSLDYYRSELEKLESATASEETVYHAKQQNIPYEALKLIFAESLE